MCCEHFKELLEVIIIAIGNKVKVPKEKKKFSLFTEVSPEIPYKI